MPFYVGIPNRTRAGAGGLNRRDEPDLEVEILASARAADGSWVVFTPTALADRQSRTLAQTLGGAKAGGYSIRQLLGIGRPELIGGATETPPSGPGGVTPA